MHSGTPPEKHESNSTFFSLQLTMTHVMLTSTHMSGGNCSLNADSLLLVANICLDSNWVRLQATGCKEAREGDV